MIVIKSVADLEKTLRPSRNILKIGFVPTMGALHEGHLSLIRQSKLECDLTVCSIFINPKQFNQASDLNLYPKPVENDICMLAESGADVLFLPDVSEIYPDTYVEPNITLGYIETVFEGKQRPGHFKGVALVVKRLFDCVQPDRAYFGQKDYQQTLIIKSIVKAFNLGIGIKVCDIIREPNGLAMSSRNIRLKPEHREKAGFIFELLSNLENRVVELGIEAALNFVKIEIGKIPNAVLEYLEIVDEHSLEPIAIEKRRGVALIAVNYHGVRLLDNKLLNW